ncbi:MAG: bifunctional hydroxymethylpyrimidine kinase/phosphomethylpyrimidine kinase [Planctomycetes bacterium]|nr:bifunctional hydroxymethylpyrimidine kinase/phosphomethylpyrimidine kinase [Planctomycetota bacterium]MBI3847283.1 bifunctional hydroxymethylpyrimidine kinase/phosphomethylpyrimidine kinase [Planctomycetota bacterium]
MRASALTIAGFDPTGGAGVIADVAVFRAHGLHGAAAITAVTAQDSLGVSRVWPLDPEWIRRQAAAVLADLPIRAIKVGVLGGAAQVEAVADVLDSPEARGLPVVLDPVFEPKAGVALLDAPGREALRHRLLRRVDLLTPNLAEAEALSGRKIETRDALADAARAIVERPAGPRAVLIKGFRPGDGTVLDLLASPSLVVELRRPEIEGGAPHGTGCALSSAIAARLALGQALQQSVAGAAEWLSDRIARCESVGHGSPFLCVAEARS